MKSQKISGNTIFYNSYTSITTPFAFEDVLVLESSV